jgi:hypothetical protein
MRHGLRKNCDPENIKSTPFDHSAETPGHRSERQYLQQWEPTNMTVTKPSFPIDFAALAARETTYLDVSENVSVAHLVEITESSIDFMLSLLDEMTDADVTFDPVDENADDPHAAAGEENIGWSLAHLIAHVTASSEEGASISSRLARGVVASGSRDRWETPWRDITTVAHCRQRLEESRRMRLAFLQAWPDEPQLDVFRDLSPRFIAVLGQFNAPATFLYGISHEIGHFDQLLDVRRQALAARKTA